MPRIFRNSYPIKDKNNDIIDNPTIRLYNRESGELIKQLEDGYVIEKGHFYTPKQIITDLDGSTTVNLILNSGGVTYDAVKIECSNEGISGTLDFTGTISRISETSVTNHHQETINPIIPLKLSDNESLSIDNTRFLDTVEFGSPSTDNIEIRFHFINGASQVRYYTSNSESQLSALVSGDFTNTTEEFPQTLAPIDRHSLIKKIVFCKKNTRGPGYYEIDTVFLGEVQIVCLSPNSDRNDIIARLM